MSKTGKFSKLSISIILQIKNFIQFRSFSSSSHTFQQKRFKFRYDNYPDYRIYESTMQKKVLLKNTAQNPGTAEKSLEISANANNYIGP